VLGLSALFGLHYKRMLPQGFYKVFSARWKPVNTDMDLEEEPSEKPIIKNGAAAINGDCTVVTYVGEKEEEDVKKELVEAAADEEKKDVEKKVEEEKEEVKEEEKKEDNDVEEAKETDPLKDESESK